jgi:flavin reductase (DIM6/NTAB) family NADH-FMN oxidoreductase RutF
MNLNLDKISSEAFRLGMRKLAGAVTIITSNGEAGEGGFTATAVCSVSDNPPTLLVCINRKNESNKLIKRNKVFAVNVLTNLQQELSNRFAGYDKEISLAQRLEKGNWKTLKTSSPILENCLVSFDCILSDWQEVATHSIAFGEVVASHHGDNIAPLLYFDGSYHQL